MNFNMTQQMQVHVLGAEYGTFQDDDKNQRSYCSLHVGQQIDGERGVGFKTEKFSADPKVFEKVKGGPFPMACVLDITTRSAGAAGGMKIKVVDARPAPVGK